MFQVPKTRLVNMYLPRNPIEKRDHKKLMDMLRNLDEQEKLSRPREQSANIASFGVTRKLNSEDMKIIKQ